MCTMKTSMDTETTNEEDRLVRRVQVTGRGSYIVSIPKHWVEAAGLKKGGRVEFSKQHRGLLLTPFNLARFDDERSSCELVLSSQDTDPAAVSRKIISLYVVGYSTIEIAAKSGTLGAPIRDCIRDVARQKLVGTEMVTESSRERNAPGLAQLSAASCARCVTTHGVNHEFNASRRNPGADYWRQRVGFTSSEDR